MKTHKESAKVHYFCPKKGGSVDLQQLFLLDNAMNVTCARFPLSCGFGDMIG